MQKDINKAIEKSEKYLLALKMLKEVGEVECRNVYELAFQKYIVLEGSAAAAQYLNEKGFRMQGARGERKHISTDITHMLEDEAIHRKVNPRIRFVAVGLKKAKTYSSRMDKLVKISAEYYKVFRK